MEMKMDSGMENKREKLGALFTLSLVLVFVFCAPLSSLPFPSLLPTGTAAFSSVTITDVSPIEFRPGDTRVVTMTVKNNGGMDAKDIRLAFEGTDYLSLVGPTVAHINTLNAWTSKEVEVTIHVTEEAPNGVYSIPVNCSWRGYYFDPSEGYISTDTIETGLGLSFSVTGSVVMNVGNVSTDPTDIRPGAENVEIRATIENSGEAAAKDIEAKLLLNDKFKPSWSGTDRSYLGRLNSGERGEAVFHIDVADNVESDTHSIPLQINYKDTKGGEYEAIREITILVKPKPDFEIVSFYTEPGAISGGDTGVILHVRIRNIGSEKAESASVRMTGEADVPFDYDVKSDFVGDLKVGEDGEAILKFDVDEDIEAKGYPLGIEVRCTGDRDLGDDNVYVFDEEIRVDVSSGSSSSGSAIPGFEVLFSLLALIFAMLVVERSRKRV